MLAPSSSYELLGVFFLLFNLLFCAEPQKYFSVLDNLDVHRLDILIVKLLRFTRCHISAGCCQRLIQNISDIEVYFFLQAVLDFL